MDQLVILLMETLIWDNLLIFINLYWLFPFEKVDILTLMKGLYISLIVKPSNSNAIDATQDYSLLTTVHFILNLTI